MRKTFSDEAWERNLGLFKKSLNMPFNVELQEGTLDEDKFCHYIIQDTKYLHQYAKVFSLAASKANNPTQIAYFTKIAQDIASQECNMHSKYLDKYGVDEEEFERTEQSPACHHYTSFLLAIGHKESLSVILAALLPCFWIYFEVGQAIKANSSLDNPFHLWIEQYGGDEFKKSVHKMIEMVDKFANYETADGREKMHEVYTYSARLEYMFWDSAYRKEKWIV